MTKKIAIIGLFLLGLCNIAFPDASQIGTTANNYIKILVPAKPAAMGEAYVANADDVDSLYYNPAGIAKALQGQLSLTDIEWFQEVRYDSLNLEVPMSIGSFGASLNWLNVTPMDKTIVNPANPNSWEDLYTFSPYSMFGQLTYATIFTDNLSLGLSAKILYYAIDPNDPKGAAASYLFDLGLIYDIPWISNLSAGLVFKNFGPETAFYGRASSQAMNIKGGLGYNNGIFEAEADMEYYNDNMTNYYLGAGWTFMDVVTLRGGYEGGTIPKYSAGGGLTLGVFDIDYAFIPYSSGIGYTNRITASMRFGSPDVHLLVDPIVFSPRSPHKCVSGPDYAYFHWTVRRKDRVQNAFVTITNPAGDEIRTIKIPDLNGAAYWDGMDNLGISVVKDGDYAAKLTVDYGKGIISVSDPITVTVDNTPPTISVDAHPKETLPNDYGTLITPVTFEPDVYDLHGISQWSLIIKGPDGKVFRTITGNGKPGPFVWDGLSDAGQPVVSNSLYTYTLYAADSVGNCGESKPETVRVLYKELVITLAADTLFDPGKADVKISVYNDIKPIADRIKRYKTVQVIVEGHTDNQPITYSKDFKDNMSLSQGRAEAVVQFFVELFGLDKKIFVPLGKGDTEPIATNSTPEGQKLNRRVTLRIRGVELQ